MIRFVLSCLIFSVAGVLQASSPSFADFDREAEAGSRLNVVFFGASLTWGANATDPQMTSYRARIAQRLEKAYPKAHFKFWDAAIGGTGSQLGVFRLDRDVLSHHPDLVFLDFSANDGIGSADPETLASYEAIIRRIVNEAHAPVVQVIFPFKWDVLAGTTEKMARRDAHIGLSKAYSTGLGDAIELAQTRVKSGEVTVDQLWPDDGVHPGDVGYELFADAAWTAFQSAVAEKRRCAAPDAMLYAPTYMTSARVRISSLSPLPEGWKISRPHVVAAYFDMLMSRWLDDEVVASSAPVTGASSAPTLAPLSVKFSGSMVMLFGESTPASVKFHAVIDGKLVERKAKDGSVQVAEFDAGRLGNIMKANAHMVEVIATGLDAEHEHTLEIVPLFAPSSGQTGQEIRLESICVAGKNPSVHVAAK